MLPLHQILSPTHKGKGAVQAADGLGSPWRTELQVTSAGCVCALVELHTVCASAGAGKPLNLTFHTLSAKPYTLHPKR